MPRVVEPSPCSAASAGRHLLDAFKSHDVAGQRPALPDAGGGVGWAKSVNDYRFKTCLIVHRVGSA
ncbi:hypothetical protein EGM71_01005 [Stenotrophomonas maltophilia]|nr:hypothetical protein EGM71_01005 [Stenotrophomonas maltophilia]